MTYRLSFVFFNLVHTDAFKTFLGFEDLPDVASSAVKAFVYLYRSIYGDRYARRLIKIFLNVKIF